MFDYFPAHTNPKWPYRIPSIICPVGKMLTQRNKITLDVILRTLNRYLNTGWVFRFVPLVVEMAVEV